MVYEKLRNYDAAKRKHGTDLAAPPADLSNLPIWHSTCATAAGRAGFEYWASPRRAAIKCFYQPNSGVRYRDTTACFETFEGSNNCIVTKPNNPSAETET